MARLLAHREAALDGRPMKALVLSRAGSILGIGCVGVGITVALGDGLIREGFLWCVTGGLLQTLGLAAGVLGILIARGPAPVSEPEAPVEGLAESVAA